MTDYVSQVAFCRKPLMVAKADISELRKKVKSVTTRGTVREVEVEDTILKGRTVSKEAITVLRLGKKERHRLYQSPDKLTYNQVFNCKERKVGGSETVEKVDKYQRRYLLWGSPSDCYNRMFGGIVTEGGKRLPYVNLSLHYRQWITATATGNFHGAYHPKYWGMDWAYQQWIKAKKLRRTEGFRIEEAIRRQFRIDERHAVFSAPRAFKISCARKRGGGGEKGTVHTNSAKPTATPPAKQTLPIPAIGLQRSRSAVPKPNGGGGGGGGGGKRKASELARDSWILVPRGQSEVASIAGTDKVPALHLTNTFGLEYELVERPAKIRRLGTAQDEEVRRKQAKLAAAFERWDLYVKRKEEHFAHRGDLTDNSSAMMKAFRVEEKAAEDARAWWKKEQAIRDKTWAYDADEYENAAREMRYRQLFEHFTAEEEAKRKEKEEKKAAEKESHLMKLKALEMKEIAKLIVLGIIVATKDDFEGREDVVITDGLMAKLKEHVSVIYQIIADDDTISLEGLAANRALKMATHLANKRSMPKTQLLPDDTSGI